MSRIVIVILVVFVVVILLVAVASFFFVAPPPNIIVTGINFYSPDDACGLNGATDYGFDANSSTSIEFTYEISGNNTTAGGTA
ncbi:MAG: hypothetical protein WBF81_08020, partial [Thermoplasmata archaeon]